MAVFGFVKFQVCLKEYLNLNLGTPVLKPQKKNVFNFQLTCFSAIVDLILWFCTSLSIELLNNNELSTRA